MKFWKRLSQEHTDQYGLIIFRIGPFELLFTKSTEPYPAIALTFYVNREYFRRLTADVSLVRDHLMCLFEYRYRE